MERLHPVHTQPVGTRYVHAVIYVGLTLRPCESVHTVTSVLRHPVCASGIVIAGCHRAVVMVQVTVHSLQTHGILELRYRH